MDVTFVGREKERAILEKAMTSGEAEMVAVIGRRRIGKTFLVRSVYGDQIDFEITGIQDASMAEQLQNFAFQLQMSAGGGLPLKQPDNWLEAFQLLITFLEKKPKSSFI